MGRYVAWIHRWKLYAIAPPLYVEFSEYRDVVRFTTFMIPPIVWVAGAQLQIDSEDSATSLWTNHNYPRAISVRSTVLPARADATRS